MDNVELIDALDHASALTLLNETDVVVLPSRDETMPIVILEAMGLGKAVISTDVGGVREWLRDGLNGLLVEKENPAALAGALATCAASAGVRAAAGEPPAAGRSIGISLSIVSPRASRSCWSP